LSEDTNVANVEEIVVPGGVNRTAAVVKGGRRFSFTAIVVAGDRSGRVGIGYAKAREVPQAVEKASKEARRTLAFVPLRGTTIPHEIIGRCGASRVFLRPAAPGTGVIAGSSVRAVLELAGIRDILTKAYGSTNPINLVKATFDAVTHLRSKAQVAALRGVEIP
jgi:small subunit ribosomal protein S5